MDHRPLLQWKPSSGCLVKTSFKCKNTQYDSHSPPNPGRQLKCTMRGLQVTSIMNALVILIPAIHIFVNASMLRVDMENEDLTTFIKATAAVGFVVGISQAAVSIYTLINERLFKLWCLCHLVFGAMLAATITCSLTAHVGQTIEGFHFFYFCVVDAIFSVIAATLGLPLIDKGSHVYTI